jgi:hypothetical protein
VIRLFQISGRDVIQEMLRGANFGMESQQVPGKAHDQRDKNNGGNDIPANFVRRMLFRPIKNSHKISSVNFPAGGRPTHS